MNPEEEVVKWIPRIQVQWAMQKTGNTSEAAQTTPAEYTNATTENETDKDRQ